MRKLLIEIIDGCPQCDHLKYLGWGNYMCKHPETKGMPLEGRFPFPDKCPLEDVPEEEIVEPGC